MKKIILICGTRTFDQGLLLPYYLQTLLPYAKDILIVEGGALGADHQARMFAQYYGIPFKEFPADWSLGKKAGPLRNEQMALFCKKQNVPIETHAFWDGESRGTLNMINLSKQFGFEVHIHRYWPIEFYFKSLLLEWQDKWKAKFNK